MNGNTEIVGSASMALYMFLSFIAGGGTVLAAVGLLSKQILNSPVLIQLLENLASSLSPEWREALQNTGRVVVEATDNIPAEAKPMTVVNVATQPEARG
jgi:hypothetical protein